MIPALIILNFILNCTLWLLLLRIRHTLKRYRTDTEDTHPHYSIRRIHNPNSPAYGRLAVIRTSFCSGSLLINTVIKVFADDDEEFNALEARELLEKLNS